MDHYYIYFVNINCSYYKFISVIQITAEFKESMKALEKISFLPEDDIYRFFDKEAMVRQKYLNDLIVSEM